MKEFRLAAAGIIIHENEVLLVRYKNQDGSTFLVGPGGGIQAEEDLLQGLKREVFEETRVRVQPVKILFVEDLLTKKYRMTKIWFLCEVFEGSLQNTQEARVEGIIEVDWYSRDRLVSETVYPEILKQIDWQDILKSTFQAKYISLKSANF